MGVWEAVGITFVAEFGAVGASASDGEARGGEEGLECCFHGESGE